MKKLAQRSTQEKWWRETATFSAFFLIRILGDGVQLGPLNTSWYLPWMIMMMENLVECLLAGETEVLGENLPQCYFVHYKSHMTWPGASPGRPPVVFQHYPHYQNHLIMIIRYLSWVTSHMSSGVPAFIHSVLRQSRTLLAIVPVRPSQLIVHNRPVGEVYARKTQWIKCD
jgi:hypothetical protein